MWLNSEGAVRAEESFEMLSYFKEAVQSSRQWLLDLQNQVCQTFGVLLLVYQNRFFFMP